MTDRVGQHAAIENRYGTRSSHPAQWQPLYEDEDRPAHSRRAQAVVDHPADELNLRRQRKSGR